MFDIEIEWDDVSITNVERNDVPVIKEWIVNQKRNSFEDNFMDTAELDKRFIEYYISENEFFLKISKYDEIVGLIKGRVEFKNSNDVIIWYYIIDRKVRGKGLGTKFLNKLISYFEESFGITDFSTGLIEGNQDGIKFWNRNNFMLERRSKGFYKFNDEKRDMLLLKRTGKKSKILS